MAHNIPQPQNQLSSCSEKHQDFITFYGNKGLLRHDSTRYASR